ncbi:TonB-dependent siderophore receptor [Acinetobacter sp. MD2]|uniref:TonB-dependent receptor n=1 Tax=Acinetobacter sp. MD2 TaxID=2600066 RepID=UPI002D1F6B84|nr:TonB-dependent siderophore receptor [Acinetobacter sp. MD2]MEB3768209.1 TonB-dependent siderophore receptor [Acinetobacter sp. MD2]
MSLIKTRKKLVSSAIASSLSLFATTTFADEVAQLPTIHAQAQKSDDSVKVDQSANTKYIAPLLDTPKSVAVVSQKLLQETSANSLTQALQNVPGITFAAGEGGTPFGDTPYIRGYSAQSSIYVDGVRNATVQNRDMFAIEQVEVTKGSSSTLSGGGGVGGSVNLITKQAHQGNTYQGTIAGGTDDYRHIMLDANKDFGNGVAGRVVVMGHQNDKPGESNGAEYNRVGIAPSIAWGLGSDTRGLLSYYYLQSNDEPDAGIPFPTVGGKPVSVKQGMYYGWKNRDFDKRENHIGTLKLEHDFNDNLTLSNVATYSKSQTNYVYTNSDDSKGNVINGYVYRGHALTRISDTDAYSDQLALRGKFNTGSIKHSFNTGVEWSYQSTNMGSYSYTNTATSTTCTAVSYWCTSLTNPDNPAVIGNRISNTAVTTTRSRTVGLYTLDSIEFTPQWLMNLGLRWDKFNTQAKYNTASGTTAAGTMIDSDSDFFSYQAGLIFKPTENGSIYASYATSANPVGVGQGDSSESAVGITINDLKPEKARTFEVGTKWDILNKRANITAAIFRTEKQNTRITDSAGFISNVGDSQVDGFEIGLNGHITDKWEVAAGYSYLDSELKSAGYSRGAAIPTGGPIPYVAKNSATLWSTYKVLPKLTLGAGAQYKDDVYVNSGSATATPKYLPAYTIYNAMAKYNVNDNVNLQLNINNITDKRYFTSAHAAHYAFEGDGRNAVLAVNFKY